VRILVLGLVERLGDLCLVILLEDALDRVLPLGAGGIAIDGGESSFVVLLGLDEVDHDLVERQHDECVPVAIEFIVGCREVEVVCEIGEESTISGGERRRELEAVVGGEVRQVLHHVALDEDEELLLLLCEDCGRVSRQSRVGQGDDSRRTELVACPRSLHGIDMLGLLALEPVRVGKLVLKVLRLEDGQFVQDELQSLDVEDSVLVEVSTWCVRSSGNDRRERERRLTRNREDLLVNLEEATQRSLVNVQSWQMRQEVVSDKDVEEDKVVDDTLEVVLEREGRLDRSERCEFEVEVFTE
jgi:hypothetical protein